MMRYSRLIALTVALVAHEAGAQLPAQKSSANGVTVTVTPGDLGPAARTWDFAVVLDTHTQDLADDLTKTAVLMDDKSNAYKALAWDGAAPGGHHRKGVLRFPAIVPRPTAVELRMTRVGEAKPRVFRWDLK